MDKELHKDAPDPSGCALTVRLDATEKARLDRLAKETNRSRCGTLRAGLVALERLALASRGVPTVIC